MQSKKTDRSPKPTRLVQQRVAMWIRGKTSVNPVVANRMEIEDTLFPTRCSPDAQHPFLVYNNNGKESNSSLCTNTANSFVTTRCTWPWLVLYKYSRHCRSLLLVAIYFYCFVVYQFSVGLIISGHQTDSSHCTVLEMY